MTIPAIPNPAIRTTANQGAAFLSALTGRSSGLNVYAYGDSFTVPSAAYTAGMNYLDLLADELDLGTVTSYGVSGMRINHGVFSALATGTFTGLSAPVSGAVHPGASARPGIFALDFGTNDYGHFAGGSTPAIITGAGGTRYIAGIRECYRAMLAILATETRVEQSAGTVTRSGAWTLNTVDYSSGGTNHYTTTATNYIEYATVTPPQYGPLAGKVYLGVFQFDPSALTNASLTWQIDGGSTTAWTKTEWETYSTVTGSYAVIPITVPVDGASHTVRVTHAGSGGQIFNPDVLLIPSVDPSPVLVLAPPFPVANGGGWNATQVGYWLANQQLLEPEIRAAVAAFPNALWVPSTITSGGLWSTDGIHLNDRGNPQRAGDASVALRTILPRLRSRALQQESDASFGII
jgi:hypothetical protein